MTDAAPSRPGLLDRLKNELTAAVVIAGGILLATGWLLIWARLAGEELPSENVLPSLPKSFFAQIALQSLIPPLIIVSVISLVWLPWCVRLCRERQPRWQWFLLWLGFGLLLSFASFLAAMILHGFDSRSEDAYTRAWVICTVAAGAVALGIGWAVRRRCAATVSTGVSWDLYRPVMAGTIVLAVLVTSAARVVDARYAKDIVPLAQAIVGSPCAALTNGRVPRVPAAVDPTKAAEGCVLGGFLVAENERSLYLAQRRNPCPGQKSVPPRLLVVPRDELQVLVLLRESDIDCEALFRIDPA